ncbi:hypothetical protein PR003_g10072 [Phytophthora rubi]|uniref:Uncharacterized protein n=1 Tax=Phytophthora rubi TaxID=129364 RepID=A0A6A4F6R5_9STRA|nr:hypothetical protein PR003_g10072 [Phytophthora rubi]
MNPPTANPVLPADAPREDPSTVEALPAVLPAANPSDAASPAIPFALRDNPDAPGDATALPASGRPSTGDVIVVDAASTPSGPESAGRTSARLRRSQGKRLGPASGASLKQRNPAMRLSGLWKWGGGCVGHVYPSPIRARRLPAYAGGGRLFGWDSIDEATVAVAKRSSVIGWSACLDDSAASSPRSIRPAVQPHLAGH